MFDAIALLVVREQCLMTVYVDDVTVSGKNATKKLLGNIRQIVSRHGLNT